MVGASASYPEDHTRDTREVVQTTLSWVESRRGSTATAASKHLLHSSVGVPHLHRDAAAFGSAAQPSQDILVQPTSSLQVLLRAMDVGTIITTRSISNEPWLACKISPDDLCQACSASRGLDTYEALGARLVKALWQAIVQSRRLRALWSSGPWS